MLASEALNQPWLAEHWPDLDAYIEDIKNATGSDRATIIIGCAMLDLILRRLLVAFMIDDATITEKLVGPGDRPLASFSARITVCRALGLIGAEEHRALDGLREIRNAYAHKLSDKINEQSITSKTEFLFGLLVTRETGTALAGTTRHFKLATCVTSLALPLARRISDTRHRESWDKPTFQISLNDVVSS